MSTSKKIHINYIPEKIEKSNIMIKIGDTITLESKTEVEEIKNSIMRILSCTNLENEIIKNKGRNIYELNESISKHLLSIISKNFSIEEKKNFLKLKIKELLQNNYKINNDIIIFIRNNKIFILDIGKKLIENKEKYNIKNKRFDGHTQEEIDVIIYTKLGENFNSKEFVINILNEIDFSKLSIKQALDYLTNDYKKDLLNKIALKLKNKFQIEDFLLKGISGKILRDNFQISKNHITTLFFETFFIKNIKDNEVINFNEVYNKILDNFLNIEKLNIEKIIDFNLKNIHDIFINLSSNKIGNYFSKLYIGYKLDSEQEKIFLYKLLNKIKKDEIIEKIISLFVDNIFEVIGNDNSKNKTKLVYIFRKIESKDIDIKINKLEGYYTISDLSNKIKQLLKDQKILKEQNKKNKNEIYKIQMSRENNEDFLNKLKEKINNNFKEIINYLSNNIGNKNITINNINAEILKIKNSLSKKKIKLKKYKNNTFKKITNSKEIKKLEEEIKKLEKKLNKANEIYILLKENEKLKRKILKIELNLDKIKKLKKEIGINDKKLNELNIIIDNIKFFFLNIIKKYLL